MTDTMTAEDPAAIEQEIRRTQENMSRTVDKIGNQLSVKNVVNALLDKADESNIDARMLLDGARRNPVALGLIAAGTIWLISEQDAKLPSFGNKSNDTGRVGSDDHDIHHRDYVSHMSSIEQRPEEDWTSYQRRRDLARANFFMVEQGHDEDEGSFRQRLDGIAEKFRDKRRAWADSTKHAQVAAKKQARAAGSRMQEFYAGNPLVGGILASAMGAAIGAALPISRQEQEKLRSLGDKAHEVIDENKDQITSQLREKKDQLLDKADAALQPSPNNEATPDALQRTEPPFIAAS